MMWVFPTSDLMYQFSVSNRYAMEVILSFSLLLFYMKCCDKFVFFSSCLGLLRTKSSFFDGFKYLCWPCPALIYRLPNQKSCNRNIPNVHSKRISRLRFDSSSDSCDSNAFRSVAIDNNIWRGNIFKLELSSFTKIICLFAHR